MISRSVVLAAVGVIVAVLSSSPTFAGLKICNRSNKVASTRVAVAMPPIGTTVQAWVFVFGGWNDIAPGACLTIFDSKDPADKVYYVAAKSTDGSDWEADASAHSIVAAGYEWPAVKDICEADPNKPIADNFTNSCNRIPYSVVMNFDGMDFVAVLK